MLRYFKPIAKGAALDIVAEVTGNRCRIEETLDDLSHKNPNSAKHVFTILQRMARYGAQDTDASWYKPIRNGLYEIRERSGLFRLLAFRDVKRKRLVVLARAFEKNPGKGSKSKQQDEQIRLALQYKREYEQDDSLVVEI